MAGTGVTIRIKSNRFPAISAAVRPLVAAEVQKAAFQIEATAKGLANVKTGTMRRSIHTVMSNGGLTGTVGPSVFYAIFQEFLHKAFMRPAAERHLPGFAAAVKAALGTL